MACVLRLGDRVRRPDLLTLSEVVSMLRPERHGAVVSYVVKDGRGHWLFDRSWPH